MTNGRHWIGMAALIGLTGFGCDDESSTNPDDSDADLVRISGICRNVDDGTLAPGVRVTLLGTAFSDEVATGDDGAYALMVPRGSRLTLHTDDFDSARGDDLWFPTINVDTQIATDDIVNWNIHACAQTVCPEPGSVALWNNYLQNGDEANGDLYSVTSIAESGGVISMVYFEIVNDELIGWPIGLSATFSSRDFVPGYPIDEMVWNGDVVDCTLGPDMIQPGGGSQTDFSGMIFSAGEPDFSGDHIFAIITDQDADRALEFDLLEIPVRPGTISLILGGTIDGEPNATFNDMCAAFGVQCPTIGRTAAGR